MLRGIRSRLTYANVVASMALFLALGGISYAAATLPKNSVGGAQIKSNAITGADVKNSSLTGSDIKDKSLTANDFNGAVQGPPGPQGPAGVKGETGGTGTSGARGFSAWDTIPPGTTVIGTARLDVQSPAAAGDFHQTVPLPGKAPAPLEDGKVNMAADGSANTADDDATCTGTVAAPTAPAGQVCIYLANSGGATSIRGFATIALKDHGFRFVWVPTVAGDSYVDITWAYTAP